MQLLSEHNRILRVGEGGGGIEYSAGPNIDITNHVISGRDWSDDIDNAVMSGISSTSGDIVNEAYNQSTAWVDEQGYLTAHQDVSNLPYVQNSALEFDGVLISGISGSGFFAESANNSYHSDDSYHADYADSADSAGYAESAGYTELADSAHVADYATIAESAYGLVNGYSGILPIVVDNEHMLISAQSAKLGVQDPLYFVEDTSASTVIGIHDSAFPTFELTDQGLVSSINNSGIYAPGGIEYSGGDNISVVDHVISVTGSVPSADRADYAVSATSSHYSHSAIEAASADSATYDNLGREITATYLTAHQDVDNLPYVQNTALESNGILISGISGSGLYATSADNAFEADHAYEADYVLSGWEYDDEDRISGYQGSAFAGQGGQGIEYEGIAPIVVNNVEHKISAQSAKLGVQEPLYFVEDSISATVIGISGLPEVEGVMYESALGFSDGYITGYDGSAISAERTNYANSATSANGAVSSQTANYVVSGWEKSDNKITGYNGTAFSAGSTYDVKAGANISVSTAGNTFTVSGKDWDGLITDAANFAYYQATANAAGKYIPYTNITTGISGTTVYNVASGIRVTAASGWTEMYNQNKENSNEAHLQVAQNYTGNKSFWAELDGAGGGILQMNWNSGTIVPNANSSYSDGTTASLDIVNGAIVYRTAAHSLTATGEGGDGENKIWQLGSERLRFWNQWGTASFGPQGMEIYDSVGNNRWYTTAAEGATRFRIVGSGQNSAGEAITGAVDLTPAYINFYDQSWNVRATLNYEEINALKALLNHVSTASASWVNPSTATGSI